MTDKVHSRLTNALDTYRIGSGEKGADVSAINLDDFKTNAIPTGKGDATVVGLLHKDTALSEPTLEDSQLLIDLGDGQGVEEFLRAMITSCIYKHVDVDTPDEVIERLVDKGMKASSINFENIVTTVLNFSGAEEEQPFDPNENSF